MALKKILGLRCLVKRAPALEQQKLLNFFSAKILAHLKKKLCYSKWFGQLSPSSTFELGFSCSNHCYLNKAFNT